MPQSKTLISNHLWFGGIGLNAGLAIDVMGDVVVKMGFICVEEINCAIRIGCFIRNVAIAAVA
jgi:hypothetical protein